MKQKRFGWLIVALLVGITGGTSSTSWARPPQTHRKSGVVESLQVPGRTFVLRMDDDSGTKAFVWTKDTRFSWNGSRIEPETLRIGVAVSISYRKEMGQLVLREVRVLDRLGPSRTKPGVGFP